MRKKSILNAELTLDEVMADMITYIINAEVRSAPHISVVSKRQLWFGQGQHFKNCSNRYLKAGLRANAGIRIPTDIECEKKERFYGYQALVKPWQALNNITNSVWRKAVLIETLPGGIFDDIRILMGRGYIRKDGTIDPKQTKGISVYILFLADKDFRDNQNRWIQNQEKWIRYQVARNQYTHEDILEERKRAAQKVVTANRKLLKLDEWKELDPAVDSTELDWGEDDD